MFFPGSLAVDPLGDVLYATSTNADLSFGGSTLFAVDLLRFERAVACFRNPQLPDCGKIDCSQSGYALGLLATVEQTEQLEAQSKVPPAQFDRCYCQRDVDDAGIVNCEPQRFIIANQTTKLGFFPGDLKILAEDPPQWPLVPPDQLLLHRGLYIAVRGDPSVTFVDATRLLRPGRQPTGSSLADPDSLRLDFNCGNEKPRPDGQPTDVHTPGDAYKLKTCAATNLVQRTVDDVLIDMNNPGAGTQPRFQLPAEPLGLVVDRGCLEPDAIHQRGTFYGQTQVDNQCDGVDAKNQPVKVPCDCYSNGVNAMGQPVKLPGTYYQYLVSTHMANGQVAAYELPGNPTSPATPVLQDVSAPLFPGADMRRGAFAVAPRVPGNLSEPWYVTSRMTGQQSTFRLASAAGPKIVPGLVFTIGNQFSLSAEDVRDVSFEPGSARAFFAVYTPPSLVVLDTRLRSDASGVPNNQVTSVVNLCTGPSRLAMARVPRSDMGLTTLATRIYVTCYLSGQLAEVDADSGELTGTIQLGRGPLAIALNFGATAGIDPCADPYISDEEAKRLGVTCRGMPDLRPRPLTSTSAQVPPRAYVSTYLDSAIAVVDLDPSSPTYRRTTARIGLPSPKKVE